MIRIRGKNVGEHLTLVQFCNDWISADDDAGNEVIVGPLAVRLEEGEEQVFRDDPDTGTFWHEYQLIGAKFVRRARLPR